MRKALLCSSALLLVTLSMACASPNEEETGEENAPAVSEVGVQGALFTTGGTSGTTKPACPVKCDPFCKTMPSGRRVCGETCICVVTDTCTCSSMLAQ